MQAVESRAEEKTNALLQKKTAEFVDYVISEWLEELEQELSIGYAFLDKSATSSFIS